MSVGTELLLGQIVDTNSAYLAGRLAGAGVDCLHMSTVGDNLARARATLRVALDRSELVVMTGGLGPTEDDLTREAIAAAVGETPEVDPRLENELRAWFAARGVPMPVSNRKQAWLIPSARALPNPNGTAPGWDVRTGSRRIVAMPGVPREMTPMWEDHVEPTLFAGEFLRYRTLKLLGIGESAVEEALGELVRSTAPTVATYAKSDGVHVRITDKARLADEATARIGAMESQIRERLGAHVWGTDADTLPGVIGAALERRGWRLATAEALSAGELALALGASPMPSYAGGTVIPDAEPDALAASVSGYRTEVSAIVPRGTGQKVRLAVRTPDGQRTADIRYRTAAEGRRRAALGALDLLRSALA